MHRLPWFAVLVAGCSTTSSTELLTSEIYASLYAEAAGDGTTEVGATLYQGSPLGLRFVDLTGDDSLLALSGSESKAMVERTLLNTVVHRATLSGDAEGTELRVVFDREVDAGAASSFVTLPAKFELLSPPQTAASRAEVLSFHWAPSGTADAMVWSAAGDCIENASGTISGDPGAAVIPANTLRKRMGEVPADCDVTVTVLRKRAGNVDPAYLGGDISGNQARSMTFTSIP